MGHFNPGHSCQKPQFKSVTDNCFIPHTCLGVTTAGMPLLKLHPVTPQGETCLGCIHSTSFLSFFYSRGQRPFQNGVPGFWTMFFYRTSVCAFIYVINGKVGGWRSRRERRGWREIYSVSQKGVWWLRTSQRHGSTGWWLTKINGEEGIDPFCGPGSPGSAW